jgi:hypothetical protein
MSTEVKVEKIPWVLIIPLSIFLGFFGTVWYSFLPFPFYATNSLGQVLCGPEFIGTPYFILIVFGAIQALVIKSGLLKNRASPATLTYLYVTGMGIGYFINQQYPGCMLMGMLATRVTNPAGADLIFPEFMVPSAGLAKEIINGSTIIPWLEWIPFISFWSILNILFAFYFISIASIFRRQWMELEKVPFPHTMAAYELVRNMQSQTTQPERYQRFLTRPFILGVIIGFVIMMPIVLVGMFSWFPDIFGWRVNTCATGCWYVTPDSPLAGIAGIGCLNKHPMVMALSYFVPLNILQSTLIFWIISLILIQMLYAIGYYTGIEGVCGCPRAGTGGPMVDPPLRLYALTHAGGLIGLVLLYLVLTRSYVLATIRAALGRGELHEHENEEPMPYKIAYIAIAISFVLIAALFMISGISFIAAILIPISAFIFWFAQVRMVGLAGIGARGNRFGSFFHRSLLWPDVPTPMTRDCYLSTQFARNLGGDTPSDGWAGLWSGFMSFRMASLMGTNNRNVLKVLLTSTIIAAIMTHVAFVWVGYEFGASKLPAISGSIGSDWYACSATPETWNKRNLGWDAMPNVLAGMAIVGALSIVHARFVWFPLEPIGFIIAFSMDSYRWGMPTPFAVAWVAKLLTLRIGGSKTYEDYGIPVAGGIVVGSLIASLIGGAAMVIRFFYPY